MSLGLEEDPDSELISRQGAGAWTTGALTGLTNEFRSWFLRTQTVADSRRLSHATPVSKHADQSLKEVTKSEVAM